MYVIKKVKLSLCLTKKALRNEDVWGSACIDPPFLDLDISLRSSDQLHAMTALPPEKALIKHGIRACVGLRASLGDVKKRKLQYETKIMIENDICLHLLVYDS
jgi:hypothetical protein